MDEIEQVKCAYCGALRPRSEMAPRTIVFEDIKFNPYNGKYDKFVNEKTQLYCADKPCGLHDQYAHEG
jgi:hypothetical protein